MIAEIAFGNLEKADDHFTYLQSEHINSPLLPEAMLILGSAHIEDGEYLLGTFYFDEYIKRYGNISNVEYLAYLRNMASFGVFRKQSKEQDFFHNTIDEMERFLDRYKSGRYVPYIEDVYVRFLLGQDELNHDIARIYERRGKPLASQHYKDMKNIEIDESVKLKPSYMPWYIKIFNW